MARGKESMKVTQLNTPADARNSAGDTKTIYELLNVVSPTLLENVFLLHKKVQLNYLAVSVALPFSAELPAQLDKKCVMLFASPLCFHLSFSLFV